MIVFRFHSVPPCEHTLEKTSYRLGKPQVFNNTECVPRSPYLGMEGYLLILHVEMNKLEEIAMKVLETIMERASMSQPTGQQRRIPAVRATSILITV